MQDLLAALTAQTEALVEDLLVWCAVESPSTDPAATTRMAEIVGAYMAARGAQVDVVPGRGHGALVRGAWEHCGMRVSTMDAETHDRVLACVSHLPHVLSYALVHELAERSNAEQLFSLAAGGFRDFTRIAGSSPEMWRDICISNRDLILEELARYRVELDRLAALLTESDGPALERTFAAAREARNRWLTIR